jgi:hypothetical protein
MASGTSAGALGAAGKWFTAILTTMAAIIALLVNAQSLGLTSWIGATDLGFTGYAVRRLLVTPRADSLEALGDTAVLAVTATDRRGAVLIGVPLLWSSEDTMIATVDSTGIVVARGTGLVRITASVREHRATATVLVRQQVARIAISGDSILALAEADSSRVSAVPFDARGHRVRGTAVRWSSSDTFIVAVDSGGRLRSRAPGRALLTATAGGQQENIAVDVRLTPFRLQLVDGNEQHAATGRGLPDPVTLTVLSRGGQPVPGAEVILTVSQGTLESERLTSDARGRVRPGWTLGHRPGPQQLRGRIAGSDSAIVVTAEADPTPEGTRIELADSGRVGVAGSALNPPVILRLTDADGLPLPDVPVSWAAADGGSVVPLAPRTDSLGQAIGRWTLGRKTGKQRLRVQVGDARSMPSFTVTALSTAGPPATLTVVSGADQKVTVGKAAQPIVLQVRDSLGNPVPGVKLTALAAGGRVTDTIPVSDVGGRATVRWTAGAEAGTIAVTVAAAGIKAQPGARIQVVAPVTKPRVKPPIAKETTGKSSRARPKPVPR